MTKHIITTLIAAVLTAGTLTAHTERQPQMREALQLLHEAQEHPETELLRKARAHLEKAEHDKGGHRAEAIEAIDRAIRSHKEGEHKRTEEHIAHAIREIEEGEKFDREHEGKRR